MIRKLCIILAVAFLTIGTFTSTSLPAIADTPEYSQTQTESKAYPSQSEYDKKQKSSDYSYTDKQESQTKSQEKQTNQTDGGQKQYAQQEQSYPQK